MWVRQSHTQLDFSELAWLAIAVGMCVFFLRVSWKSERVRVKSGQGQVLDDLAQSSDKLAAATRQRR